MELLIKNAEGNLNPSDREYAAAKLGKLDRFFHQAQTVKIVHREEKNSRKDAHRIEVTVLADGYTVRCEEHDTSIRAAIDKVYEKLENRLTRLKGRIVSSHRRRGASDLPLAFQENHVEVQEQFEIFEKKRILLKPMSYEEAALQLEMVGHPFFLFRSEATGEIELLYRKKDGKYGLIHPEK